MYVNRGTAYKYVEDYEEALRDFERSLEVDPRTESSQKDITEIRDKISRAKDLLAKAVILSITQQSIKPKKLGTLLKSIPVESHERKI